MFYLLGTPYLCYWFLAVLAAKQAGLLYTEMHPDVCDCSCRPQLIIKIQNVLQVLTEHEPGSLNKAKRKTTVTTYKLHYQ
jgi:hypothetical protein